MPGPKEDERPLIELRDRSATTVETLDDLGEFNSFTYTKTGKIYAGGEAKVYGGTSNSLDIVVKEYDKGSGISCWGDLERQNKGAAREIVVLRQAKKDGRKDFPEYVAHGVTGKFNEPYLIMKRVEGKTLHEIITDSSFTPTLEEGFSIAASIADTLEYVHRKKKYHRDVKPGNIIVEDSTGRVIVIDWSTARDSGNTFTNTVIGTLDYVAPEAAIGRTLTSATDVFGLGKTLQHYFLGDLFSQKRGKVTKNDFKKRGYSQQTIDALFKATEENPKKRYQTPRDFIAALNEPESVDKVVKKNKVFRNSSRPRNKLRKIKSILPIIAMLAWPVGLGLYAFGPHVWNEEEQPAAITQKVTREGFEEISESTVGIVGYNGEFPIKKNGFVYDQDVNNYYVMTTANFLSENADMKIMVGDPKEGKLVRTELVNIDEEVNLAVLAVPKTDLEMKVSKVKLAKDYGVNDRVMTVDYWDGRIFREGIIYMKNPESVLVGATLPFRKGDGGLSFFIFEDGDPYLVGLLRTYNIDGGPEFSYLVPAEKIEQFIKETNDLIGVEYTVEYTVGQVSAKPVTVNHNGRKYEVTIEKNIENIEGYNKALISEEDSRESLFLFGGENVEDILTISFSSNGIIVSISDEGKKDGNIDRFWLSDIFTQKYIKSDLGPCLWQGDPEEDDSCEHIVYLADKMQNLFDEYKTVVKIALQNEMISK